MRTLIGFNLIVFAINLRVASLIYIMEYISLKKCAASVLVIQTIVIALSIGAFLIIGGA